MINNNNNVLKPTGVVNSFMSSGGTGYDSKVWESLDHFYDVQAWIPKDATLVNKAAFAALDKPTQDAILKASADAEARGWKLWEEKTNWYLDQLKAKGMKVQAPSPALKDGFKKAGETLTADWLKKAGPDGAKVLEAYRDTLDLPDDALNDSYAVLRQNGNMSSATVLFVLQDVLSRKPQGRGLLSAMGPGFSAEHVLLDFGA